MQPFIPRHPSTSLRCVIAVGLIAVLVGFALVVPRGSMPGSASARNVRVGGLQVFSTPGPQGLPSLRYRIIRSLIGLVLVVAGFILIASSG